MLSAVVKKWLLIFTGTAFWSVTMVKSGLIYPYGMGFWGPQGHDGIWHWSLINSLSRGSWSMPLFAGEAIKNYHLGFDLFVAFLHRITFLPINTLYFQILPPLFALSIGYLTYRLILDWTKSESSAWWSTFFVYFGGSFGWVITLIRNGSIGGESLFWAQQSMSTLVNPPFALSLCLILLGLWLLPRKPWWSSALVFGLVSSVKIYGGILVLAGLFFASFKNHSYLKIFLSASLISLLLWLPFNSGSGNLLVWHPLWFLGSLMNPDHLNWPKYFSALATYTSGGIWYKAIPAYAVALAIFLMGNLSTRIIAFWHLKSIKNFSWWEIFLWSAAIAGIVPPMLFLQQGTAWNTIQFFYYTQVFLALVSGVVVSRFKPNLILSLLIIILTVPTAFSTLPHYLPSRPPAKISTEELQVLKFLSQLPRGTVLTYPYDPKAASDAEKNPPRPLYLYESTAYVSALSGQPVYLEDEVNLNILGYSWQARRQENTLFMEQTNVTLAREFLDRNHISYIYLPEISRFRPQLGAAQLGFREVFSNSQSVVWARNSL